MTVAVEEAPQETEVAIERPRSREVRVVQDQSQFSSLLDTARFEQMQRVATMFSTSTVIPEHYRKSVGNCFIAIQMATRLGVDPFMFMQKSYIVHGKPGIEAQLAVALINSSGIFTGALEYEIQGDDPDDAFDESYRARAFATRKDNGQTIFGPWVDWKMVKAEGWYDKPGSKWKTMPEIMFRYRAASFFGRLHCPERLMGMQTAEELQDAGPAKYIEGTASVATNNLDSFEEARKQAQAAPAETTVASPANGAAKKTLPAASTAPRQSGRPGPKKEEAPTAAPADDATEAEAQAVRQQQDAAAEPSDADKCMIQAEELVRGMTLDEVKTLVVGMDKNDLKKAKQIAATDLGASASEEDWRNVAMNGKALALHRALKKK